MATSAKKVGIKWNCTTAIAGGTDISSALNKASLERMIALIETTTFGLSGTRRDAGLADASIDIGGFYIAVVDTSGFETDAVAGTERFVRMIMDSSLAISATNPVYGFAVRANGFKGPEAAPQDMLTFTAKLHMSDGLVVTRSTSGTW